MSRFLTKLEVEEEAPARFEAALRQAPQAADRWKWELSYAEMLARKGDAPSVARARTLLAAAVAGLPEGQRAEYGPQVQRVRRLIGGG
jgi:hypothetical protein